MIDSKFGSGDFDAAAGQLYTMYNQCTEGYNGPVSSFTVGTFQYQNNQQRISVRENILLLRTCRTHVFPIRPSKEEMNLLCGIGGHCLNLSSLFPWSTLVWIEVQA